MQQSSATRRGAAAPRQITGELCHAMERSRLQLPLLDVWPVEAGLMREAAANLPAPARLEPRSTVSSSARASAVVRTPLREWPVSRRLVAPPLGGMQRWSNHHPGGAE